jgi:hypothetical protein
MKNLNLALLVTLALSSATVSQEEGNDHRTYKEILELINKDKGPPYVPVSPIFSELFKESPLKTGNSMVLETYRFSYFPTFSNPWLIQLTITGHKTGTLIAKRLSGEGGFYPGELDSAATKTITGDTFSHITQKLRNPDAFRPYGDLTLKQVKFLGGTDGSDWYLESRNGAEYRCTSAWCAQSLEVQAAEMIASGATAFSKVKPKPFLDACLALIEAAELRFDAQSMGLTPKMIVGEAGRSAMSPAPPCPEQPGAGQPATQPADKAPVKDQPSTPTPKDDPR